MNDYSYSMLTKICVILDLYTDAYGDYAEELRDETDADLTETLGKIRELAYDAMSQAFKVQMSYLKKRNGHADTEDGQNEDSEIH